MATATLARKKFTVSEEVKLPSILTEAKEKLGYNPAAVNDLAGKEARRDQELRVAAALDELKIEPLDAAAVNRYQAAKITEVVRRSAHPFVRYMHSRDGETVVTILGTLVIGLLIAVGVVTGANYDDTKHVLPHAATFRILWRAWLALPTAWTVLMTARHKGAVTYTASWASPELTSYRLPVPEFALARALAVKELLPEARFFVETLDEKAHGVETHVTPSSPDPFLSFYYGQVKVYLDVWDEPKFEGRRTI